MNSAEVIVQEKWDGSAWEQYGFTCEGDRFNDPTSDIHTTEMGWLWATTGYVTVQLDTFEVGSYRVVIHHSSGDAYEYFAITQ